MPLPAKLLADTKNYLNITWDDAATDEKLAGILARGMRYIMETGGAAYDFTAEEKPRELLLDYARYTRSDALDEFALNYREELIALQNGTMLGRYALDTPQLREPSTWEDDALPDAAG